jgi:hypothetical protein
MKPLRVLGSGGELHHGGRGAFFHEGVSAVKRGA